MGLLFAGALGGLATVAWPVYLHIRSRRHRRVQVVPSLKLFGFAKKQTRRIRLEQFLLMVARMLLLTALCFMLAQPYWETALELPLPAIAGEKPKSKVLALLIDDSLTAWHGAGKNNRLAHTKALLGKVIRQLPSGARIVFAPATSPYPTIPMNKDEARDFLAKMRMIPRPGNASAALRNLKQELAGKRVCLLAAAPRNFALWEQLKADADFSKPTPLLFLDTTPWQAAAIIQGLATSGGKQVLQLRGNPEEIKNLALQVHGQTGDLEVRRVSIHEALRGKVPLSLPGGDNQYYRVALPGDQAHPWASYYLSAGLGKALSPQAVILRGEDRESLLVDQIVTAVVQSFHDGVRILHLKPGEARSLPQASALVIVGGAVLPAPLRPWLAQQIDRGLRILFIPTAQAPATRQSHELSPLWQAPKVLDANELPFKISHETTLNLDDLLLQGLKELRITTIIELGLSKEWRVVLATRRDRAVLAQRQLNRASSVWALGFPLTVAPDSPVWHPVFPLLLERLLFAGSTGRAEELKVCVGASVSLSRWFQQSPINGTLILPDGAEMVVRATTEQPLLLPINQAGPYKLINRGGSAIRLANFPREDDPRLFTREQWGTQRPNTRTRWLEPGFKLAPSDFVKFGGKAEGADARQKYDLSPVAFLCLLIYLLMEAVLLVLVWKRKKGLGV